MPDIKSIAAVKEAIGGEDFGDNINVVVTDEKNNIKYVYKNIYVKVYYEYGYEQMKVEVHWEDDSSCPDYSTIGLRGSFNTNFQKFTYFGGVLSWKYNDKTISIDFN